MTRYERPLLRLAAVFATFMALVGWWTAATNQWNMWVVVLSVIGTALAGLAWWGIGRESLYLVAGIALANALIIPTEAGIVFILIGFIIFAAVMSLRLFNTFDQGGR